MSSLSIPAEFRAATEAELESIDGGATAIEYGLIAALISVSAIAALGAIGGSLETMFGTVATEL